MKITKKALDYLFGIVKYLYFNIEIGQEIEIEKLSSKHSRAQFVSALDYIIDRNLCLLGGFKVEYTDTSRTSIKKIPHTFAASHEGTDVLPFEFNKTPKGEHLVLTERYLKLFEYGNS
jgi:hypothetical protein